MDDGSTLRQNLLKPVEQGAPPSRLLVISADAPTGLAYLYDVYAELSMGRRPALTGLEPLSFEQVYFWQKASGFKLHEWERKTLLLMDLKFRDVMRKEYPGPKLDTDDVD